MMRQYLKESFHWLHLAFFKPITLQAEAERLTKKEALKIYFKVFPIGLATILATEAAIGGLYQLGGYSFDWFLALGGTVAFGLVGGPVGGLQLRQLGLELRAADDDPRALALGQDPHLLDR